MDRILQGSHIILGTTSTAKLLHTLNPWLYKTRTTLGQGLALCGHEVPSAKVNASVSLKIVKLVTNDVGCDENLIC